jgi:phosphohistidine phosphatase
MKLFLIRHADAVESSESISSDDYRYITPGGRRLTRKIAKKLKEELKHLDIIFVSPLIRAVQTAEVIATKIKFGNDVIPAEALSGNEESYKVTGLIKNNSNLNAIALVGHEPMMSSLVKSLSDRKDLIGFSKSGVCLIDFNPEQDNGKFIWYFNPKNMEFER